ncbi:M20/M25/M40 family metallo-hydrolase [Sphingomonas gilva]|uniref:M20/M25/M40 family metallo-hydrolase n=1 Tax=Sphingomonas gilva TaxID=2305907 RepID=A0A396RQZ1_9SPHN|nr:M20/M25/M40 family metallo-hydrolase [Sphingomonas gilva]RHW18799.1 M20/M25/M40 family metallo-hydrolase [Sphingomonas gilva]
MRTLSAAIALALASASTIALANGAPEPAFTPEAVRAHVEFLADDLLEGRDAGTRGYDIAARYVATEMAALGLKPGNGESWYQQVPFVERAPDISAPAAITIAGTRYANGENALVNIAAEGKQSLSSEVVFVGYGLKDAAAKLDDYAGLDVRGKTVVMLYGTPKGLPSDVAASLNSQKAKMAQDAGATGVITLFSPQLEKIVSWDVLKGYSSDSAINWANPDGTPHRSAPGITSAAYVNGPAADALFAGAPRSVKQIYADAERGRRIKGFALTPQVSLEGTSKWRKFESPNVVGVIPGSDPALRGEYVLLMAHLDHEGIKESAEGEDKIYNGAMDNAAGIATMLEVARAFAESGEKPRRSILFAAVTAEEDGLLGSDYLARHPLPGGKVVSVVNLDMPALLYDFTDVTAFGAEHSTMGPAVEAAVGKYGVKLAPDPMPEENLFVRSDHYSFVKQGVPSVFLVTGFANGGEKAFKDFLAAHYHKPSDDTKLPFNWQAGAKFAQVNYAIARDIANAPAAPRWYADSPFGAQYAKDQPKAARPEK